MKKIRKRSECPISFGLDFFGDKWSLLIIRDIVLSKKSTFGEFSQSGEGIATNVLTDRLKMLETEGFILKYPVQGKSRIGYCLTEKGTKLIPIVIEIALWGVSQYNTDYQKELTNALKADKEGVIKQLISKQVEVFTTNKGKSVFGQEQIPNEA